MRAVLALLLLVSACSPGRPAHTRTNRVHGSDPPTSTRDRTPDPQTVAAPSSPERGRPGPPNASRLPPRVPSTPGHGTAPVETGPTGASERAECPDPRTCPRYTYIAGASTAPVWPKAPDGVVRISYEINPTGFTGLSENDVVSAIRTAFATWESALPSLRFDYMGRTSRTPAPFDGRNTVGVGTTPGAAHAWPTHKDGLIIEADTLFQPGEWSWTPCAQADNSCTNRNAPGSTGLTYHSDLQAVATHEVGHWLWLGHPVEEDAFLMTMFSGYKDQHSDRYMSTLGLGDVLGARSLYPCSCPMPRIYHP